MNTSAFGRPTALQHHLFSAEAKKMMSGCSLRLERWCEDTHLSFVLGHEKQLRRGAPSPRRATEELERTPPTQAQSGCCSCPDCFG
jgi:hypothetical protein